MTKMSRMAAIVATLVLVAAPAFAVEDTTPGGNLGGYDAQASGVAVSFRPFLPALVSTGDVPFEASFALSASRVKSGGNALGRGAFVWPGSTLADFGPVIGVAFGQPEIGALVPKWPLQAEATQDSGEVLTGLPPVASMRAFGGPDRAEGDSRIGHIHVPRIVEIAHVLSTSDSVVTDGNVSSSSIVELHGVSLLAGFVKAETIRSISRTTSLGSAASSSGDVDIIGLTIGGTEVSVTDDGFQVTGVPPDAGSIPGAGGEPFPGQSPEDAVNAVLEALGARITLFNSISKVAGGNAERMQPGVVVSVNNPVGGTGPIPPGRFDIFLASTAASSLATTPFSIDDIGTATGGAGTTGAGGGGGTASSSTDAGPDSVSIGSGAEVGGGSVSDVGDDLTDAAQGSLGAVGPLEGAEPTREEYRFGGLPIGLVVGLLVLAALIARRVRTGFIGFLAPANREGDET